MLRRAITLTVNGREMSAEITPRTHLADFLRESEQLTGTHLGCEHGVCGACTLMLNGAPARSCIAYAAACEGAEVRTIEGFVGDPLMDRLRDAFSRHHALQCGYCTPGMLITAYDVVRRLPDADARRIREELSGNLCRCTGYVGIVAAIQDVIAQLGDEAVEIAPESSHTPLAVLPEMPRCERAPTANASGARATAHDDDASTYRVRVDAGADALWTVLRDVEQVTRCLPGASLTTDADEEPLGFRLDIALGPMRAGFEGSALIDYDDERRGAEVAGRAHDAMTRSSGEGTLSFHVESVDASMSELVVAMDYVLSGPLAQFSRGPVVDAVVEQMLMRFADNAARLAGGGSVKNERALGGTRLGIAALWSRIRRWLGR